jgi:hypothetical protein
LLWKIGTGTKSVRKVLKKVDSFLFKFSQIRNNLQRILADILTYPNYKTQRTTTAQNTGFSLKKIHTRNFLERRVHKKYRVWNTDDQVPVPTYVRYRYCSYTYCTFSTVDTDTVVVSIVSTVTHLRIALHRTQLDR